MPSDLEFPESLFLLRDGLASGRGRGELAHARWHRPFPGVRSSLPLANTLAERALQYLPRLRQGEWFSHATALAVLGCPIRVRSHALVDVSSPKHLGAVSCRGVTGHRHEPRESGFFTASPDTEEWIPVVPPLTAVQQAAALLPFRELVVALDFLLLRDPKRYDQRVRVSIDELARHTNRARGRGSVRLREAAALAREGAESRMETLMRLAGVRVGMPELQLQFNAHDGRGKWIGRFDAADPETLTLFEYDGSQHLWSARQRRRDAVKHQVARDAGWRILVLYLEDVTGELTTAGRRMLAFSGRPGYEPVATVRRLLDELSDSETEPATPLPIARVSDA